jgi:mono/diheme cytochrome c family protein
MENFLIKADTGMLHTHVLIVTLYLIQLMIKVALLSSGKYDQMDKFSKKVRIPSIILSVLLLATGVYLMVRTPTGTEPFVWVKLIFVLSSIPVGIIAMKRRKAALGILAVVFLGVAMALALVKPAFLRTEGGKEVVVDTSDPDTGGDAAAYAAQLESGRQLFSTHCMRCHGADGNAGFQGAKPLSQSVLSEAEISTIVRAGKGLMPPNEVVSEEELKNLASYVKYLRK